MKTCWIIFKRQVTAYFTTPAIYIAAATFLLVAGLSFCRLTAQSMHERLVPGDILFGSVLLWIMILALITMITMGALADEQRSGTLEMLLTAPVSDTQAVIAKFGAALLCFILICLPTAVYIPLLNRLGNAPAITDPALMAGGYLILLLVGSSGLAFGIFASSLTRNQIIAAGICFTFIGLAFFTDIFQYLLPPAHREWLALVSPVRHIMDFSQGIFDTRPLLVHLSGTALFLFAAVKMLESRHWQ